MAKKGNKKNGSESNDYMRAAVTLSKAAAALKDLADGSGKTVDILEAAIKDGLCNYKYEITGGLGLGDKHKVEGSGLVMDSMREAYAKFNVHLAVIDDAFKNSGIEIDDIDKEHGNELTGMYRVTGFKSKGSVDNMSIVLVGNKYVSSGHGRMELETPKIALDNLSSYKWYNELLAAVDNVKHEVKLYMQGYYVPVKVEEDEPKDNGVTQLTIASNTEESFADFENNKV